MVCPLSRASDGANKPFRQGFGFRVYGLRFQEASLD